ncbi:GNAT family N-acetyltransferase [Candidatus Nomurabacteria bacterium]|nr:MAG: GNAT family N-acetyltransferase [Candidatus Nomurabacteria bacterium]
METQIEFRKATIADVERYIEIEKTAIGKKIYLITTDPEEVRDVIETNEIFFIYVDNLLAGRVAYEIKNKNEVYLSDLIILPEFQGLGIARKAALFQLDQTKEYNYVWFVTHPHNNKILTLYLSLGFTIESWKDNYFGDGEPRLVLARTKSS